MLNEIRILETMPLFKNLDRNELQKITFENGNSVTLNKKGDFIGWATIIAASKYIGTGTAMTNGSSLAAKGKPFKN